MSLDLNILKRLARTEVIRHIETGHSEKDLIIDSSLMKPLERIIGVSALKERGINKIFALENTISSKSSNVIYILSPDTVSVKCLINHILVDNMNDFDRNRWVLFYPGRNIVTDYLLETEGVMGDVIIDELELNFIPLDTDVLSMEYPLAFNQLYVNKTHIPLYHIAKALFSLESLFGKIPQVYTIGKYSSELIKLFKQSMAQYLPSSKDVKIEIGTLIIIDRNVDPITICSSQLTFEGLLSDVYSIKSGFIKPPDFERKILLTDQEPIFEEIRDLPLFKTASILRSHVEEIQNKQTKLKGSTVSDMKKFLTDEFKRLKLEKQSVDTYFNLCEDIIKIKNSEQFQIRIGIEESLRACEQSDEIIKYLEWQIVSQRNLYATLKLLCLWNCTKFTNINKSKKYFIDLFLQSYGFEHLSTFYNLERSNFFTNFNADAKISYKNLSEDFNIIPKEGEPSSDFDISNVFSKKYRPFSISLIEKIISKNFPKIDCEKYFENGIQSTLFCQHDEIPETARNVFAVLFIGGICHTEISCLKILAKKYNKTIIILTTAVLNGSDIMEMHIDSK